MNHPKSMFQLSGLHCNDKTLNPKPSTLNPIRLNQSLCSNFLGFTVVRIEFGGGGGGSGLPAPYP